MLITLGSSDFVEFLGAFFITTILAMDFRLYVLPLWKYVQAFVEQKVKVIKKILHRKTLAVKTRRRYRPRNKTKENFQILKDLT